MRGEAAGSQSPRISGRVLRRSLWAAGMASLAAMLWAARSGHVPVVTWAAVGFAAAVVVAAAVTLAQTLRWPQRSDRAPMLPTYVSLLQTTRLATLCYGWAAVAMQGLYLTPLTGLRWQHGWQYAAAMALLTAATFAFGRTLSQPLPGQDQTGWRNHVRWATPLGLAQALIAGGGLAALAISGKLWSERADWAANRVFAALAVAILAVTLAGILARHRLQPPQRHP